MLTLYKGNSYGKSENAGREKRWAGNRKKEGLFPNFKPVWSQEQSAQLSHVNGKQRIILEMYFFIIKSQYRIVCYNVISKLMNTDPKSPCEPYGGIKSGKVCCASSCGVCGGMGCNNRPGGKSRCCGGGMPLKQVCGQGQNAPCRLKNGKSIMSKLESPLYNTVKANIFFYVNSKNYGYYRHTINQCK